MAVKISSLSSNSLQGVGGSGSTDRTEQTKGGQPLHKTIAGSDDTVSLTSNASQLQALESRIAQMSVVDAQLVEEVQMKLSTGSFRIDPESAAKNMLSMELSLP